MNLKNKKTWQNILQEHAGISNDNGGEELSMTTPRRKNPPNYCCDFNFRIQNNSMAWSTCNIWKASWKYM